MAVTIYVIFDFGLLYSIITWCSVKIWLKLKKDLEQTKASPIGRLSIQRRRLLVRRKGF